VRGEHENAFFVLEDQNKNISLEESASLIGMVLQFTGGSANPKIHARTTPDLPISL
jgi:hypothetical protein